MKFRMSPVAKLSLAAALFAFSAFLALRQSAGSWSSQFAGAKAFPNLDAAAVSEIEISGGGKVLLTLKRKSAGEWLVKELGGHPADLAKIEKTLASVASMKSARKLEELSARDMKELGIEPSAPSGPTIRLRSASGEKLAELALGRGHLKAGPEFSPQNSPDGRYCLADGKAVLSSAVFDWLDATPGKWLAAPSFDMTKALSLSVWASKSGSWSVSRKSPREPFVFDPPLKGAPSPRAMGAIIAALSKPPVLGALPEDALPGLKLEETVSASVTLEGGASVEFTMALSGKQAALKISNDGKPGAWLYESSPNFVKKLLIPPPQEQAQ